VVGAGGVALAALLSACGGSSPAPQPAAAPAKPAEAPKPAEAAQPAAQAGPGGFSGGGSLKLLLRSHFVPAYDAWVDRWAADWGTRNRVDVSIDHILSADLAAKIAAEVASGAGHDILGLTRGGEMPLYNKQLVDVSDIAKPIGEKYGGWVTPLAEQLGLFEGAWKALPEYFIEFSTLYRKDLFDANGLKVPETWDDVLKAGTVLKSKGNPIGIAINQKSNDSSNSWTAVLWSYGASYVAKDGKTVAIDVPETREALKFAIELYKNAMTNEVLSWDDTANNLFLAGGKGSWIQNPISALRTIEKQTPELAQKIFIALPPGGPKGRFQSVSTQSFGLMNWSPNQPAAKAFLADYYGVFLDAVKASEGYNQPLLKDFRKKPMPALGDDPKYAILQDFDQLARAVGHPGPRWVAGERKPTAFQRSA
jgi:multiple sugar transport system substrate-binding protein